jgi:hypothetical protein
MRSLFILIELLDKDFGIKIDFNKYFFQANRIKYSSHIINKPAHEICTFYPL